MRAVVVTAGDELLIGQVVNTNAAWLGAQLSASGVDVIRIVAVGDDLERLASELHLASRMANLVLVTGGLGPTHDDLTREALASFLGVELRFHPEVFEQIRQRFETRGRMMPESNRRQAMVPEGFTVLANPVGTAPGLWYEGGAFTIAVLPGVPHEMRYLFRTEVQPRLIRRGNLSLIMQRTLRTAGLGESMLQEKIGVLSDLLSSSIRLAYLPGGDGVRLRLTALGGTWDEAEARLNHLEEHIRTRIGRYIYAVDRESLEEVVGELLLERSLTIAVAESCTGGYVASRLTDVPGSSAYLLGGIVAYSNELKTSLLGVNPDILSREGAVSQEVASEMARGVRLALKADIGVSTTGVAGPSGGTPEKPVGTVWIGYSDENGTEARLLHLASDRRLNKELATTHLLNLVRMKLSAE